MSLLVNANNDLWLFVSTKLNLPKSGQTNEDKVCYVGIEKLDSNHKLTFAELSFWLFWYNNDSFGLAETCQTHSDASNKVKSVPTICLCDTRL